MTSSVYAVLFTTSLVIETVTCFVTQNSETTAQYHIFWNQITYQIQDLNEVSYRFLDLITAKFQFKRETIIDNYCIVIIYLSIKFKHLHETIIEIHSTGIT